jgi:colanic acid/amylovoran biosynthesis glycosyltransferase
VWKTNGSRFMRTISYFNKRYIEETYHGVDPAKIKVVYLGVDTNRYVPRQAPREAAGPMRVVSVGNMVEKKGHAYLIRASAMLAKRGCRFNCSIVGEGDTGPLVRVIEKHGVGESVKLLGALPHEAVGRLLNESDVFVLACIDARDKGEDLDGIPVSLMEAMALGLSVVSTQLTGIPELIEDGVSGLLVPEKDEQKLADALARLIDDAGLRAALGRGGRRRIEERFDLRTNVIALADQYRQAIGMPCQEGRIGPS